MNQPLLTSKFSIPSLFRGHIQRLNLTVQLQARQNHKLTLICTPAGFGKSSLLSEWASQSPTPCAWLSLDVNDNVPARFLAYLFASCRFGLHGSAGKNQFEMRSIDSTTLQEELTTFIHRLATIEERFTIILDNYQMIENQMIHDGVTLLLNLLPPQVHLFISSRSEPALPLARFHARDQVAELRADDLRFTFAEAIAFFKRFDAYLLPEEQVATLHAALEWYKECGLHPDDDVNYANQDEYLVLARLLINQDLAEEALPLLTQLYAAAEESQRERDMVKLLTLLALAYRGQGNNEDAFAALAEAVCLAEREEYLRTFLDEGAPIVELLREVNKNGIALLFTQKLLATFDNLPNPSTAQSRNADKSSGRNKPPNKKKNSKEQSFLVEPLTPRELEVLRLMADGNRNNEIAGQLTIASSTVKKHVGNILGKLTAKNRTQAVVRAREQGLI